MSNKDNKEVWARTLLTIYDRLENLADKIDEVIMSAAMSAANPFMYSRTQEIYDEIIEYYYRKIVCINLKVLIDNAFKLMEPREVGILKLIYVYKRTRKEVADHFGLSIRTEFRKEKSAYYSFAEKLEILGYDENRLEEWLKDQVWLRQLRVELGIKIKKWNLMGNKKAAMNKLKRAKNNYNNTKEKINGRER